MGSQDSYPSSLLEGRLMASGWLFFSTFVPLIIWAVSDRHTSIVVFGQEIFYGGQGIRATIPGMSPACLFSSEYIICGLISHLVRDSSSSN